MSALAIAMRCFWPPEIWFPLSPTLRDFQGGDDGDDGDDDDDDESLMMVVWKTIPYAKNIKKDEHIYV